MLRLALGIRRAAGVNYLYSQPASWDCPELLYVRFTSKEQTLIPTLVLTVKLELLCFSYDSTMELGLPRTSSDFL